MCFVCWLTVTFAFGSFAQSPGTEITGLRAEIESLKLGQRQLQKEMQLIRAMLAGKQLSPEAPPLPGDVLISTAGSAALGSPSAKIMIVEFTDYLCPFCARYSTDTFWRVVQQYVKSGHIQYFLRNFPLDEAHPLAGKTAEAAECAGKQGKYWEAHEQLFRAAQGSSSISGFDAKAVLIGASPSNAIGINRAEFEHCLDSGASTARVNADRNEALRVGVDATPTFFFGYRDSLDPTKMHAVKMLTGSQPLLSFERIIEYLLDPPPTVTNGGKN